MVLHLGFARAILAAKAEELPRLENCGRYLAQDNKGQWHYINHAGTWQACPPPFPTVEAEREACAQVADAQAVEPDPDEQDPYDEYEMGCRGTARRLAAAIRKRGEG